MRTRSGPTEGSEAIEEDVVREEAVVEARDGFPLSATWFHPGAGGGSPGEDGREEGATAREGATTREAAPVAVVAPAVGVRQDFYAPFARWLAERGFAALTFDQRGMGVSGGPPSERRVETDLADWAEDVAGILAAARGRFPDVPLVYVGHSMGLTLLALSEAYEGVEAVVGVATPSAHWRWWRGLDRVKMWLGWHLLFPGASRLFGYLPGRLVGFGADLPRGVALQWARWARHREYVVDADGRPIRAPFEAYRGPLLALSASDDAYAPREAVESLLARFSGAGLEHRHLHPGEYGLDRIGHLGFFREGRGEPIWEEIAAWLEARTTP